MNNALITFTGRVATAPERRQAPNGTAVVNMRVATTERRFDRKTGAYADGASTFYTVTCWSWVAERVLECLEVGDPIIVSGRLAERSYARRDGSGMASYLEVSADAIGPDLCSTSVQVTRRKREAESSTAASPPVTAEPADPWTSPLRSPVEPAA